MVYGTTTDKWHMDDMRVHTSNIRVTYEYIRVTYGYLRVHKNDIRMTYEYIRVAYWWHTSTYKWRTDDIRMTYEYIRVAYGWHTSIYKWRTDDIQVTYGWQSCSTTIQSALSKRHMAKKRIDDPKVDPINVDPPWGSFTKTILRISFKWRCYLSHTQDISLTVTFYEKLLHRKHFCIADTSVE